MLSSYSPHGRTQQPWAPPLPHRSAKDDTCILAVKFRHGETAGSETPGADGSEPLTVA